MTNALDRISKVREALSPQVEAPEESSAIPKKFSIYQQARKMREENPYFGYADVERIIKLPVGRPLSDEEVVEISRQFLNAEAFAEGKRLFHDQAKGLVEFLQYDCLFGAIPVGEGKTFLSLAIPSIMYNNGIRKIVLFVPPNVMHQLVQHDIRWMRNFSPISYPIHVMGGRGLQQRRLLANSDRKGLYIIPYSLLSTRDSSEMLEAIRPEAIICDECHNLSNRNAARTKRLLAYIDKYHPIGVGLSGTITAKTIQDYYHLIRWCLGENNPLPNSSSLAREWGAVIDADSSGGAEDGANPSAGPLMPLVEWAKRWFPKQEFKESLVGFRAAYKVRLNSAPGVVGGNESKLGTSLIMHNVPVRDYKKSRGWEELEALIKQVNDEWLTPGGDEIEHAILMWKWLHELCAGFYNELYWPTKEVFAKRKQISETQAGVILEKAKLHHLAQQEYAKELRSWLSETWIAGMDTPRTVGQNMSQHGSRDVPESLYKTWKAMKDIDFEGRPDRDSRAIRICPYKIDEAVRWAKDITPSGALIWVYHQEMGTWLYDELLKAGIDALHAPAGEEANQAITDLANGNRIIVASVKAHGTGKNLQHFQEQYFLQWPRDAKRAEQALGRTHRNGQKADELIVHTNHTLEFDQTNFAATLNDACYIQQTTGNRQKLLIATYYPIPKILPSPVLHERGLQTKRLTLEQQKMLDERFASEQQES